MKPKLLYFILSLIGIVLIHTILTFIFFILMVIFPENKNISKTAIIFLDPHIKYYIAPLLGWYYGFNNP